jgi:hypothetical protein
VSVHPPNKLSLRFSGNNIPLLTTGFPVRKSRKQQGDDFEQERKENHHEDENVNP